MDLPSPASGTWPKARAALLTVVLAVHGLAAAPIPHVVTRAELQNPVSAEEVARWAERLSAVGYTLTPAELSELVLVWSERIGGAHRAALAPVKPLFQATGTNQGWALFANPDTHPIRLQIRLRRQGSESWELLFQRLDPDHAWASDLLAYRRVRGVYDAGGFRDKPRGNYKRFAAWISTRVLEADPTVEEVEVRSLRTHTTLPGEPEDDRVEERHVIRTRRKP